MPAETKGNERTLYEQFYVIDVVFGVILFMCCVLVPLIAEAHIVRLIVLSVGVFLSVWEILSAWRLSEKREGIMNPLERKELSSAKYAPWNVILGIVAAFTYYFLLKWLW